MLRQMHVHEKKNSNKSVYSQLANMFLFTIAIQSIPESKGN